MSTITRTNLRYFTWWIMALAVLLMPGIVLAANITAGIEGSTQGRFGCGNTDRAQAGTAVVTGLDLGVETPVDPSTGQISGATVVGPLTIIKPFDSCTPLLLRAGTTGERLAVTIRLYKTTPEGAQQIVTTLLLNDAVITSIGAKATANPGEIPTTNEEVSFSYQTMSVKDEVSGNEVVISSGGGKV
jgi:type VI secretion system Hcp family effector